VLDGEQPGGDPGLVGGDGLAVAPPVRTLWEALAEMLDFADVGLAFVGLRGDREEGGVRGRGVQDEADGLAPGVRAGQGDDPGAVGFWPGLPRLGEACLARSRRSASIRSARSIWSQVAPKSWPTGPRAAPRPVQYSMSRTACGRFGWVLELAWMRSWVLQVGVISPVLTKRTRPRAKGGGWGRAASQMASRRAVT
jgi:hypothetical protein